MASISFVNYFVNNMSYMQNNNYDDTDENYDVSIDFSAKVVFVEKKKAIVDLTVELGNDKNRNTPFLAEVTLSSLFEFSYETNEKREVAKKMVASNGVAIIYPYIRNIVSDLTLKGNQFPSFVLPVINVVQLLEEQDSIEIIDLYKNEK